MNDASYEHIQLAAKMMAHSGRSAGGSSGNTACRDLASYECGYGRPIDEWTSKLISPDLVTYTI